MPLRVKLFVTSTALVGALALGTALLDWHSTNLLQFVCYLLVAVLASTMKVRLPGMESTMSVHFIFVLLGVMELSLAQTLLIGCTAALVQSLWKTERRPETIKVIFNVLSMSAIAIWLTYKAYHYAAVLLNHRMPPLLLVVSVAYFLTNTAPVAIVIALVAKKSPRAVWYETFFWSFPYYFVGAAVVGVISLTNRYFGWQNALMILPFMYGIYRSYRLYLGRLEEQKKRVAIEEEQVRVEKSHLEEVRALHLRTIEALALAIDAKDHNTLEHLHRVRVYAVEVAKELGLSELEMEAIRAAALLHDIGKLAIPDHILNKPGRLTPEEFEKVKIHPIVGADILERISFKNDVASIVRAHHEKWDGTGYPDGLKGDKIPIGARILAAVDCLDALASDRIYRKAMPLDEAMKAIASEAETSFDPRVIEILQRRYRELESLAIHALKESPADSLNFGYNVERGKEPGAGFENDQSHGPSVRSDFLTQIASARQEAHTLFELCQDLGNSLSLDETLSLLDLKLRKLVPYDSIVVWVRKGDFLSPEFVSGDNFRLLSSLTIPMGKGLCGWVAQQSKPIVNGDPEVELSFARDTRKPAELRATLAVPLEGLSGLVGVLSLYQTEANSFESDHLRILQVITSKVALFIENALSYRQAEQSATSDYLTGMPNARALSLHLDQEIARCRREHSTMAVMVCDLNGFKMINDRYGHLAGDKVLKVFASLIRQVCRDYDYVARVGGDEFIVVASNLTPESVTEKSMLLSALAQEAGRQVCGTNALSASLGAVFYPQDGADAEQLLAEADKKMYGAKHLHYKQQDQQWTNEAQSIHLVAVR
jgi:diguanylate cyclase (GGDEF)-like protein/putative nucleotidyltransferase with HDIG domain